MITLNRKRRGALLVQTADESVCLNVSAFNGDMEIECSVSTRSYTDCGGCYHSLVFNSLVGDLEISLGVEELQGLLSDSSLREAEKELKAFAEADMDE